VTDPAASTQEPVVEPSLAMAARSFQSVFDAEFSYVCRCLRRLGARPSDVEDLAQEVFVAVHRKFDAFDGTRPLRPWLFGFAHRVASNYHRLARHRHEVSEPDEPIGSGTPEELLSDRQAQALLLSALDQLTLEQRSVVVMHDIDGFTAPEIASALLVPLNTVYSRVRIGRDELKKAVVRIRLRRGES
jgi:RNA polymerase sigma-70 factor (ECF subfamily)